MVILRNYTTSQINSLPIREGEIVFDSDINVIKYCDGVEFLSPGLGNFTPGSATANSLLAPDSSLNLSGFNNISSTYFTGTLQTASQPNISTLSGLTSIGSSTSSLTIGTGGQVTFNYTGGTNNVSNAGVLISGQLGVVGQINASAGIYSCFDAAATKYIGIKADNNGNGRIYNNPSNNAITNFIKIDPAGSAYTWINSNILISGYSTTLSSWTTNGSQLTLSGGNTYTDNGTAGTRATATINSFGQNTIASTNAVTITQASTVYIAGAPIQGTNTTLTNTYSLVVGAGNTLLSSTTVSSSTTTGALVIGGGLGVAGNIYSGAIIYGQNMNLLSNGAGNITATNYYNDKGNWELGCRGSTAGSGAAPNNSYYLFNNLGAVTAPNTTGKFAFVINPSTNYLGLLNNNPTYPLDFGSTFYNMIVNLYGSTYGLGACNSNLQYFSAGGHAWYNSASAIQSNASALSGPTSLMTLSSAGVLSIPATTTSSSTTTGALVVSGGLGVAGATYIGGILNVTGNITGTLATAAQPNITSHGTLTGLTVTSSSTNNISISDASNNTVVYPLSVNHLQNSNGAGAISSGSGILFQGPNASSTLVSSGRIYSQYTNVTNLSHAGKLVLSSVFGSAFVDGVVLSSTGASTSLLQVNGSLGLVGTSPTYQLDFGAPGLPPAMVINMYNGTRGFGASASALDYYSDGSHSWYVGGTAQSSAVNTSPSGTNYMTLSSTGVLSLNSSGVLLLNNTTGSTSSTTGALQCLGGAYFGTGVLLGSATASTSTTTGALVLSGGMGVAKNSYFGQTLFATNLSSTSTTVGGGGNSQLILANSTSTSLCNIYFQGTKNWELGIRNTTSSIAGIAGVDTFYIYNSTTASPSLVISSSTNNMIIGNNLTLGGNNGTSNGYSLDFCNNAQNMQLSLFGGTYGIGACNSALQSFSGSGFTWYTAGSAVQKDALSLSGPTWLMTLSSSGVLSIPSSTASSSNTTGALVVTGGAGIGGNLYVGGNLVTTGSVSYSALSLTTQNTVDPKTTATSYISLYDCPIYFRGTGASDKNHFLCYAGNSAQSSWFTGKGFGNPASANDGPVLAGNAAVVIGTTSGSETINATFTSSLITFIPNVKAANIGLNNTSPTCPIDLGSTAANMNINMYGGTFGLGPNNSYLNYYSGGGHKWWLQGSSVISVGQGTSLMTLSSGGTLVTAGSIQTASGNRIQVTNNGYGFSHFGSTNELNTYCDSNGCGIGSYSNCTFSLYANASIARLSVFTNGQINIGNNTSTQLSDNVYPFRVYTWCNSTESVGTAESFNTSSGGSNYNNTQWGHCSARFNDNIVASAFIGVSDRRIKTNIENINTNFCKNFITDCTPVSYNLKQDLRRGRNNTQFGYIAQELDQKGFHSLVTQLSSEDDEDLIEESETINGKEYKNPKGILLSVSYTEIIPILAQNIKMIYSENDLLKAKHSDLNDKINNLTNQNQDLTNTVSDLTNKVNDLTAKLNDLLQKFNNMTNNT